MEDELGSTDQHIECLNETVSPATVVDSFSPPTLNSSEAKITGAKEELLSLPNPEERMEDQEVDFGASPHVQQELQDVTPHSTAIGTSSPRVVSNSSFGASSLDEVEIQECEAKSPVSDSKDDTETCQRATNVSLLNSSFNEDSVVTNGEILDVASSSASKFGDISQNGKLQNYSEMPDIANQNEKISSHGIHNVVLKSDGGSFSGAKSKPLFAPGFLGKRPLNRCAKKDVSWQVCCNSTLNGLTNACTKPELSVENHIDMDDPDTNVEIKNSKSSNASIE